jgi:hypothetical protein
VTHAKLKLIELSLELNHGIQETQQEQELMKIDDVFQKHQVEDAKGEVFFLMAIYHIRHLIKLGNSKLAVRASGGM